MSERAQIPLLAGFRLVLVAGFLGLLAISASAGWYSLHTLRRVTLLDDDSTRRFMLRSATLEELQTRAYDLNSRVRDFLLDREPEASSHHRQAVFQAWDQTQSALERYARSAPDEDIHTLHALLLRYWSLTAPALEWDDTQRANSGFELLSDQLTPLRDEASSQIDLLRRSNEHHLSQELAIAAGLIAALLRRLQLVILFAFLVGTALAAATWLRYVRMEQLALDRYERSLNDRAELEALSARLVEIQEEERRAISRELHDETGQALSGMLVDVANVAADAPDLPPRSRERLSSIRSAAEATLRSVRNLSLLLRPSMLDDLGLAAALRWQARETERLSGLRVELDANEATLDMPDDYRTAIYRVVQEALRNAARHASARSVLISVRREPALLVAEITDDGRGFDPALTRGLGLLGMQERIAHLHGRCSIRSSPGAGTLIRVELPPPPPESNL